MEDKLYLAALHKVGINQTKLKEIFLSNDGFRLFYENLSRNILEKHGFKSKQIDFILKSKDKLDLKKDIFDKIQSRDVNLITIFDTDYPSEFESVVNKPFFIYVRGDVPNGPKFSIVGSRKITNYGKKVIENIGGDISNYFTIVSGGAYGCDTYAHNIAIKNNKKTISIIGTGIDIDYPVGNKDLYDKISTGFGAIISIFPLGEVGNAYNFPIRNELVAGSSVGTLIVEAQEKSGTLITAQLVLDSGRDLFAIPGEIYKPSSSGANKLISTGQAKAVLSSNCILEEYNISSSKKETKKEIIFSDLIEKNIYNLLVLDSLNLNQISININLDIPSTSLKLSMMEISGLIRKNIGGNYEVK